MRLAQLMRIRFFPFSVLTAGALFVGVACSERYSPVDEIDAAAQADTDADADADASILDGSTVPSCEDALLCDDFERSSDMLTGPWNPTLYGNNLIVLSLDTAQAKRGTASLHARDPGTGGTGALYLDVTQDVPIRIELDLRISGVQPETAILVEYLFEDVSATVNVALDVDGIKLSAQSLGYDADNNYSQSAPFALVPDTWTHVVFTFDKDHRARLALPERGFVAQLDTKISTNFANTVRLGLPYVSPHADHRAFDVWYDDVVISR